MEHRPDIESTTPGPAAAPAHAPPAHGARHSVRRPRRRLRRTLCAAAAPVVAAASLALAADPETRAGADTLVRLAPTPVDTTLGPSPHAPVTGRPDFGPAAYGLEEAAYAVPAPALPDHVNAAKPARPAAPPRVEFPESVLHRPGEREPLKPIPETVDVDSAKVALGRALFHDPRLSRDNTTACVSCHDLVNGGDDGRRVSVGVEGREGPINAPTVFNVGLNFRQFWDGRARDLEQQIDGPVQAPAELGSLWPEVLSKLHAHDDYTARFQALYPDGISRANVKDALAEYMRSLMTPNGRFDRWLKGETDALSLEEKRGYALFKHYGCVSCHQGANVGGNMFQVFGVLNEYFKRRGNITDADFGRYNITGNPADRHAFKVPSLRMAALTAPYLHDGSAETLRDAVDAMFEFQLGREAPDADKEAIVAFIRTLPGENRELP